MPAHKKEGAPAYYSRSIEVEGVRYVAQFNGLSAALDALDACTIDANGAISAAKLTRYILERVIVEPANLTPDDFADMDTLNAVVKFGREVMQGRFRTGEEPA